MWVKCFLVLYHDEYNYVDDNKPHLVEFATLFVWRVLEDSPQDAVLVHAEPYDHRIQKLNGVFFFSGKLPINLLD